MRTAPETVESVIDTNLTGTIWACKFVSRIMLSKKVSDAGKGPTGKTDACIINVSSLLGLQGGRGAAAYAASKAGVIGMSGPR